MGNFWIDTFETVSQAYHQKIAKDRADKEGIVVNPPDLGNRPGEGEVTYTSEVQDVLIPYTTREDSYQYYETRNYVNDINQEHTQVLQTYDDDLNPRERYTYGHERISYENQTDKTNYQYLTDARGSVTGLTQNDSAVSSQKYDVYGHPKDADKTGNPYGYTGEARDITGLNYLRARYYDSKSTTFLSEDSYQGEQDNPLSQNGYSYVENNPVNYIDPSGHKKNIFQKAWGSVKKAASNAWQSTKKFVGDVWQGTKQVVSNVVNWVSNKVDQVANWASNTWQGIQNWAGNALSGGNYNPYNPPGVYPTSLGLPSSYLFNNYAQQQAIQTAQRQQRITNDYSAATGNKGKPKTKEGKNIFKNWGESLKNTYKKFCQTANRVKNNITQKINKIDWSGVLDKALGPIKTIGAFGQGLSTQVLENNGIIPTDENRTFYLKDWVKNSPGYNWGVFAGKVSGLIQAGVEYTGSFLIGTGGTGFSIVASPASGGASLAGVPASYAVATVTATHATGVLASTIQGFANNSNYSSPSTAESLGYTKTNERSHGQAVYKNAKGKPKYITKDVDSHNGGSWKGADTVKDLGSKKTRSGTYDQDLNRIGD